MHDDDGPRAYGTVIGADERASSAEPGLMAGAVVGQTHAVLRVLLEAFWPSRRIMQFDEFCRPAA